MKSPSGTSSNLIALLLAILPAGGFVYSLYRLLSSGPLLPELYWVDATTVLMISLLLGRGIYVFRAEPPLKIIAVSLLDAFSFIYCFESIYKFLFLGWRSNPAELRELLLQIAATGTILLGFYYGDFRLGPRSLVFASLFAATMALWMAIGYPQLFMGRVYTPLLAVEVSQETVYLINRAAKGFLFLAYLFLYADRQTPRNASVDSAPARRGG
jgi:hypothetical protein